MKKKSNLKRTVGGDNRVTIAILIMLALADALGLYQVARIEAPQRLGVGQTTYTNLYATGTLQADGATTLGTATATTANVTTLNVAGVETAATFVIETPATAISLTNAAVLTPTGSYQQIQSAGTVTPTITTTSVVTGTLLRLVNTSNTSIIFVDNGTLMLTGNITLGQYDSLSLIFDGTNWIELSTSNN